MRTIFLLAAAALSGCGSSGGRDEEPTAEDRAHKAWASRQPLPSAALVGRIEALLTGRPCIGDPRRWRRRFAFRYQPEQGVRTEIVEFRLEAAGPFGWKADRLILPPDPRGHFDDRPIDLAAGDYDRRDGRVRIAFCGPKIPPGPAATAAIARYGQDLRRRLRVDAE